MYKAMKRKRSQGFTLIELMIVVAIIGILAVLAIYGVRRYVANAKESEARNSLGAMAKDQTAALEQESISGAVLSPGTTATLSHSLCLSGAAVPATAGNVSGKKYQSSNADWMADQGTPHKGFACLKFQLDEPQYYVYAFTSDASSTTVGTTWTATANGDLNGDGTFSTFTLSGAIVAGNGGAFNVAPGIQETNPDE